ncbi:hypothetical protein COCON_G00184850 [Conger conger]|uniref:Uncharacterized protein n=1 Tax=Conger conger TaxID=82655 RepID=A0A9Q1D328_CONCO|nr:hypothetical protein COCON_G00184850 [Conger conger]
MNHRVKAQYMEWEAGQAPAHHGDGACGIAVGNAAAERPGASFGNIQGVQIKAGGSRGGESALFFLDQSRDGSQQCGRLSVRGPTSRPGGERRTRTRPRPRPRHARAEEPRTRSDPPPRPPHAHLPHALGQRPSPPAPRRPVNTSPPFTPGGDTLRPPPPRPVTGPGTASVPLRGRVNKHKPWIETSYHGVISENTDTVLLDPPLVALDKDAPVPFAGKTPGRPIHRGQGQVKGDLQPPPAPEMAGQCSRALAAEIGSSLLAS